MLGRYWFSEPAVLGPPHPGTGTWYSYLVPVGTGTLYSYWYMMCTSTGSVCVLCRPRAAAPLLRPTA